jgi:hypothetical protein
MSIVRSIGKTKIVGFLGKARSGKDTGADYLVKNHGYTKMSFAKPIKDVCEILFGFDNEQLHGEHKEVEDPNWGVTPRLVMQWLGTDVFRNRSNEILPNIGDNFWVNSFKVKYQNELKKNPNFKCVLSDVRFQNEIDAITEMGGQVIRVHREVADNRNSKYGKHESEDNIDNLKGFSIELHNNNTFDEFYTEVKKATQD